MDRNIRIARELMKIAGEIERTAAATKKGPAVEEPFLHFDGQTGEFVVICRINPTNGEPTRTAIDHIGEADRKVEDAVMALSNKLYGFPESYDIRHALGKFNSVECAYEYVDFSGVRFDPNGPSIIDILGRLGIGISREARKVLEKMFPPATPEENTLY